MYSGDSSGRHFSFIGFYGSHGHVPVDAMLRAVAHSSPMATQEAGMQIGIFAPSMIVTTPFGFARVMTSADSSGIVVVKSTKGGYVYAINAENVTPIPQKSKTEPTVAELKRDLRKARRELARQQAALVKRKSVARYQALRIREAKRTLQVAVQDLCGVAPLSTSSLTELAACVAQEADKRRGFKVGDNVRYKECPQVCGTIIDMTEGHIQIRPAERGTPTYWGIAHTYERIP